MHPQLATALTNAGFQELCSCLEITRDFYKELAGGNPELISEQDVIQLQGRCPRYSASDRAYLERELGDGRLFSRAPNATVKQRMWEVGCQYPMLIPSLEIFFHNLNYISLLRDVLKKVLLGSKPIESTLRNAYRQAFTGYTKYQRTDKIFEDVAGFDRETLFMGAYERFWLCSMRCWPDYLHARPRIPRPGMHHAQEITSANWMSPEEVAQKQGFTIPGLVVPVNGQDSSAEGISLTTDDDEGYPSLPERFGIPFQTSRYFDRNGLFYPVLMDTVIARKEITLLFVRHSFFTALFPKRPAPPVTQTPPAHTSQALVPYRGDGLLPAVPDQAQPAPLSTPPGHEFPPHDTPMPDASPLPRGVKRRRQSSHYLMTVVPGEASQEASWEEIQRTAQTGEFTAIYRNREQVAQLPDEAPPEFANVILARNECMQYNFAFCFTGNTITEQRRGPWELVRQECVHWQQYRGYAIWLDAGRAHTVPAEAPQDLRLLVIAHTNFEPQGWRDMQIDPRLASRHS
jgi:Protein of unknown function (DUF3723)